MNENFLFQDISEHVNMNKYAGWATMAPEGSVSMEAFLKIFFSNFFWSLRLIYYKYKGFEA